MSICPKVGIDAPSKGFDFHEYRCERGGLYFSFQKVTETSREYWECYAKTAISHAEDYLALCRSTTHETYLPFPNEFANKLGLDEQSYHKVMKLVQQKKFYEKRHNGYFKELQNPLTPIPETARLTLSILSNSERKCEKYMVYISQTPTPFQGDDATRDIIMSFVFITSIESPIVTHIGIFKNPLLGLDIEEKHRGLSMELHGFAATVAMTRFCGKKYMVTHPLGSMRQIMSRKLGSNLHLGTNEDLRNSIEHESTGPKELDRHTESRELLRKHPPIYFIDGYRQKIAKDGVDLSHYLENELPDEQAEVIDTKPLSQWPITIWRLDSSSMIAVVALKHLAPFWDEKKSPLASNTWLMRRKV